jgi:hypothetical protein
MVAFGATWNMDRFIWIIPLVMRLIIQPYVYNFIAKSKLCKVYLKAKVIAYLHLVSVFGGGLVIYSSYVSEKDYVSFFLSKVEKNHFEHDWVDQHWNLYWNFAILGSIAKKCY